MKIAIIGGGVAAFEAAKNIRTLSDDAEITIYSREAVPPYRRPALSRMAAEELADAQFFIKPAAFYAENRIGLELGRTLRAIDPNTKTLTFDSGSPSTYDRLLLATGSHCFYPPVPGMDLDGVMSLREYADLQKLRARLDAGVKNAAVIGGGLLGLELAQSLLERGCLVTVFEGSPLLLPRNLDEEAAGFVLKKLGEIENLTLRFGCRVEAIAGEAGKATGVTLERDGYQALKNTILREGDTLVIKSLDRLSRSKEHIMQELRYFKERHIIVRVIDLPTTMIQLPEGQEWVFDMINNILIEVLASIAEQERLTTRQRQAEGIAAAKERGAHLGRPGTAHPANWDGVYTRWRSGELTAVAAMRELGLKRSTFYKLVRRYEEGQR